MPNPWDYALWRMPMDEKHEFTFVGDTPVDPVLYARLLRRMHIEVGYRRQVWAATSYGFLQTLDKGPGRTFAIVAGDPSDFDPDDETRIPAGTHYVRQAKIKHEKDPPQKPEQ